MSICDALISTHPSDQVSSVKLMETVRSYQSKEVKTKRPINALFAFSFFCFVKKMNDSISTGNLFLNWDSDVNQNLPLLNVFALLH